MPVFIIAGAITLGGSLGLHLHGIWVTTQKHGRRKERSAAEGVSRKGGGGGGGGGGDTLIPAQRGAAGGGVLVRSDGSRLFSSQCEEPILLLSHGKESPLRSMCRLRGAHRGGLLTEDPISCHGDCRSDYSGECCCNDQRFCPNSEGSQRSLDLEVWPEEEGDEAFGSSSSRSSSSRSSGAGDFELWVETDLDAAWCLDSQGQGCPAVPDPLSAPSSWRDACRTSTIRRRWEDFEALSRPAGALSEKCLPPRLSCADKRDCLRQLGLPEDADAVQIGRAFRRQALRCHPDKSPEDAETFYALSGMVRALVRDLESLAARTSFHHRADSNDPYGV